MKYKIPKIIHKKMTETQNLTFIYEKTKHLISNFRRVVNVVLLLLGNSLASGIYVPTFRNTLFRLHLSCSHDR